MKLLTPRPSRANVAGPVSAGMPLRRLRRPPRRVSVRARSGYTARAGPEGSFLCARSVAFSGSVAAPLAPVGPQPGSQMISVTEYVRHDAMALAELIRRGEISARELLEVAITRAGQI